MVAEENLLYCGDSDMVVDLHFLNIDMLVGMIIVFTLGNPYGVYLGIDSRT